ncbi:hypothetical protein KU6B_14910 [Mameliella alba]|nr:hypothetical protein KU6B_14910 [Mameliella alba]
MVGIFCIGVWGGPGVPSCKWFMSKALPIAREGRSRRAGQRGNGSWTAIAGPALRLSGMGLPTGRETPPGDCGKPAQKRPSQVQRFAASRQIRPWSRIGRSGVETDFYDTSRTV